MKNKEELIKLLESMQFFIDLDRWDDPSKGYLRTYQIGYEDFENLVLFKDSKDSINLMKIANYLMSVGEYKLKLKFQLLMHIDE